MAEQTQLDVIISLKDEMSSKLSGVSSKLGSLGSSLATMGGYIAKGMAVGVAGITAIGVAGVKSAADFEQTKIAMTTMTGSAESAGKILADISKFAAETPFEFPELATTTKQLMAFGMTGNEAVDGMKMLGDISAGLNVPIGDLGYLLGTLKTQGRAFTMDIRQFAMRGLPIYEALSKTMGKSVEQINEMVTAGDVGFPDVQKALQSMTAEGGKFHGMMAAQSKSLSGLWSTLKDNTTMALREIIGISAEGNIREGSIFDRLRQGASAFIFWIDANKESIIAFFQNLVNKIIEFGSMAWTYIQPVYELIKEFFSHVENKKAVMIAVLTVLTSAFAAWGISVLVSLAPIIAIIGVITGVVLLFSKMWNENWGGIQEKTKSVVQALLGFYRDYLIPLFTEMKKRTDEVVKWWRENWGAISDIFAGIWQNMKGVFQIAWAIVSGAIKVAIDIFTGNWKKAWEDVIGIFKGVFGGLVNVFGGIFKQIEGILKLSINWIIKQINSAISSINKVKLPEWMGGGGINIKTIPQLATGTNYVPQDMIAYLHQGEAVIPKEFNQKKSSGNAGGITIIFNGDNHFNDKSDMETLIDKMTKALSRQQEKADWGIA